MYNPVQMWLFKSIQINQPTLDETDTSVKLHVKTFITSTAIAKHLYMFTT